MAACSISAAMPNTKRRLKEHGIEPIDMVVVNLYAFEKTAAIPASPSAISSRTSNRAGRSMVRSAARNFEDVAIVTRVRIIPISSTR